MYSRVSDFTQTKPGPLLTYAKTKFKSWCRFSGVRSHVKLFLLFWLFWWNTSELLFGLSWTPPFVICQRGPWAMGIRVANFQDELQEHGIPCLLDLPAVGRLAFFCQTCKEWVAFVGQLWSLPCVLVCFFSQGHDDDFEPSAIYI